MFDSAVRRGVESPWERIRALDARTKTPLALALRGRFLVGSRPLGVEFVRRFVASAAESGIEVFRLHDPLNDVSNLREAGEAITSLDREFDAGLIYSPDTPPGPLVEAARRLPDLGAARVLVHDPSGALEPHKVHELLGVDPGGERAARRPLLPGRRAATRSSPRSRRRAPAPTGSPPPCSRSRSPSTASPGESLAEALDGLGIDTGVDVDALWRASDLVDEYIGDEPVTPLAPRISVRAARHRLPAGLVAALDTHLRAHAADDRIDDVLAELQRIRAEAGSPPLAAPIGQVLASQALLHVLSAERYATVVDEFRDLMEGKFGTPPAPFDPDIQRAVALTADDEPEEELDFDELREDAAGLASSEEELILLAMFGEEAEPLLRAIRARATGEETMLGGAVDQARAQRIQDLVRVVQESGVAEITVEEGDLRVTVRRTEDRPALVAAPTHIGVAEPAPPGAPRPTPPPTASCAWSRRWSAPSTARPSRGRRRSWRRATSSRRARRCASSRR